MQNSSKLYSEILNILEPFNVPTGAHSRLLRAYTESWRTYHNSSHILQMLELSRSIDINLDDLARQRLELMILYHDAWYKIGRPLGQNEKESSVWAYNDLSNGLEKGKLHLSQTVKKGIIATAKHTLEGISPDHVKEAATLLDLDLWGLGQTSEHFQENTEKVWREYEPTITRKEFDVGRANWAHSFLGSRTSIYHTDSFLHLNEMARENLRALINK